MTSTVRYAAIVVCVCSFAIVSEQISDRRIFRGKSHWLSGNGTSSVSKRPQGEVANVSTTTEMSTSEERAFVESLKLIQDKANSVMETAMRQILPMMVKMNSLVQLSPKCTFAFLKMTSGLRQFKDWAVKMIDASGKVPEGILHGTLSSFGAYDQCVDIIIDDNPHAVPQEGEDLPRGQYCAVEVRPILPPKPRRYTMKDAFKKYPQARRVMKDLKIEGAMAYFYFMKFRLGLCLPSTCNKQDLDGIAKQVSQELKANIRITWCEKKEPFRLVTPQIVGSCILGVLVLFTVVGTTVELFPKFIAWLFENEKVEADNKGIVREFFLAFSAFSNCKKILNTTVSDKNLASVHGIRVISIFWIMLCHTYFCRNQSQLTGMQNADGLGGSIAFQVILNGAFAAETFFFISGFLVVILALRQMDANGGQFNYISFYLHRYWRLTPAFILISVFVMMGPLHGFGPIWHETVLPFVSGCRRYWWTNLVYISNFIRSDDTCLPHGWYLACDMQYYLLAPVIIITLYRRASLGKFFIFCGMAISAITVALVTWILDVPPAGLYSLPDPDTVSEYMDTIASKPYTHFSAYCIGMAAGYFIFKRKSFRIKPVFQLFGWAIASAMALSVVYGTLSWNKGYLPTAEMGALYAASSRIVWTLAVAWVVILCTTGQGGLVNTFLSWKGFIPLSRLTYMTYLLHPIIMYIFVSYLRSPMFFNQYAVVYMFFAHAVATFSVAFLFSLAFEIPFFGLEKVFHRRLLGLTRQQSPDRQEPIEMKEEKFVYRRSTEKL